MRSLPLHSGNLMARLSPGQLQTARHSWRLLLLALIVCGASACNGGTSVGKSRGTAPASVASQQTVAGSELAQKGGGCELNKRVSDPPQDSAEWTIWRAYQLALGPDDEAAFQAFVALFPPERNQRELREMYWPRLRANVHKYIVTPGKPDFTICRSVPVENGRKYFIVTAEAKQMPPPITIGDIEGKPRILFLTPF
jgi:hypothetical protein